MDAFNSLAKRILRDKKILMKCKKWAFLVYSPFFISSFKYLSFDDTFKLDHRIRQSMKFWKNILSHVSSVWNIGFVFSKYVFKKIIQIFYYFVRGISFFLSLERYLLVSSFSWQFLYYQLKITSSKEVKSNKTFANYHISKQIMICICL